ncbi:uncharacterized protein METZ01_LOCUS457481, partial [marine metagenome]
LRITIPTAAGSSDSSWGDSGFPISITENTVIENAILGSGDDVITCNLAANTITCGSGNDIVYDIKTGDTVYGGDGIDRFSIGSTDFALIDGGDGLDYIQLTDTSIYGSDIDLRNYNDSSFVSIDAADVLNNIGTLVRLSEQSILNFNAVTTLDIDEDGDVDYYFYIYADSGKDLVLVDPQEWTFYKTIDVGGTVFDFYASDGGDTYFASTIGSGVYETFSSSSTLAIDSQAVAENLANAAVGSLTPVDVDQL